MTRRMARVALAIAAGQHSLTAQPQHTVSSSDVLSWLSSLPFPSGAPARYDGVRLGDEPAAVVEEKKIDPANPPLPAPVGSVQSDSFRYSPARRGLFAARDAANGTELLRIPFDHMFNYSSNYASTLSLPTSFGELVLGAVHSGSVLDSQALLALRLLHQYQVGHEWRSAAASGAKDDSTAAKLHWDPFLSNLPRPSSVCFFRAEELAELQIPIESPVLAARSHQLDTMTESYLAFDELIKSKPEYGALFPSGFTERWYRWAYGVVLNTALEVPVRDEEGVQGALLVIAPALNHINHANPPYHNVRLQWNEDPNAPKPTHHAHDHSHDHKDKEGEKKKDEGLKSIPAGSGSLSVIAVRDIRAGEELLMTYGSMSAVPLLVLNETAGSNHTGAQHKHDTVETHTSRQKAAHDGSESHFTPESFFQQLGLSNSQLLVHHGLSLPSNEFERIALDIGLDSDSVGVEEHHYDVLELKRQIIDLNELDHGTLIGLDGRLDPFFIQALRTKHLSSEDLAHLSNVDYEFSPEHGYLSLQNELKWQLQLVVSIENLLTAYPTTLADDLVRMRAMLHSQGRAAHRSGLLHALAYRVCLKRILHSLVLRSLSNIHELFLNISTQWSTQLHTHNLEEEAELAKHLDLAPAEKAQLMAQWTAEQSAWFSQMEEWKAEMDKWEGQWRQWVQTVHGVDSLLDSVPHPALHPNVTPDTLDEMLDPGIHALQLEHSEEDVMLEVEDEAQAEADRAVEEHAAGGEDDEDDEDEADETHYRDEL